METTFTFRHSDSSPALEAHVRDKLDRMKKYFIKATKIHVILTIEKSRHVAEVTLSENHRTLYARDDSHDMYRSIDGVLAKIQRQLRKVKEKVRAHH
jgi:putative sigma-54 modulation protein